ncbi:LOW QUALITY PROTEIN: hypothetical protein HID58_065508 [Brassica napus]|uniref:Uncharacterized protein n=1 Tax=Brassica napus TaxID=3708 RepID=A0ABQ7ZD09_BRANA|nr:LOW QUALITY PROTEIN: hypothetical protein HID58_065508 [Brassica napus]
MFVELEGLVRLIVYGLRGCRMVIGGLNRTQWLVPWSSPVSASPIPSPRFQVSFGSFSLPRRALDPGYAGGDDSRLWLLDDPPLLHFTSDYSFTASCPVLRFEGDDFLIGAKSQGIDLFQFRLTPEAAALQAVHRFSMVGIGRRSSGVIGRLGSTICQSAHPGFALVLWCYVTVWLDFLCRFMRLAWQVVASSSTRFSCSVLDEFGDGLLLVRARSSSGTNYFRDDMGIPGIRGNEENLTFPWLSSMDENVTKKGGYRLERSERNKGRRLRFGPKRAEHHKCPPS